MITYLTAFIFYTLAMVGILLIGFIVYKKIGPLNKNENKGMIKILDSLPIGPKKVLLVVKIKNEKFLIASGLEHTTFLSKLNDENSQNKNQKTYQQTDSQNLLQALNSMEQKNKNSVEIQDFMDSNINPRVSKKQNTQFDELHQARLNKLQRQFRELYEKEEKDFSPVEQLRKGNKQKIIKQLLKELNNDNDYDSKIGSNY